MNKLKWRAAAHAELALLLKQGQLQDSRAVGSSTVYQLSVEGRELLAISLPDGQALVVEPHATPAVRRRRIDPQGA